MGEFADAFDRWVQARRLAITHETSNEDRNTLDRYEKELSLYSVTEFDDADRRAFNALELIELLYERPPEPTRALGMAISAGRRRHAHMIPSSK